MDIFINYDHFVIDLPAPKTLGFGAPLKQSTSGGGGVWMYGMIWRYMECLDLWVSLNFVLSWGITATPCTFPRRAGTCSFAAKACTWQIYQPLWGKCQQGALLSEAAEEQGGCQDPVLDAWLKVHIKHWRQGAVPTEEKSMSRLELFYVVVSCWHIDVYRKLPQPPNQIQVCHDLDSIIIRS